MNKQLSSCLIFWEFENFTKEQLNSIKVPTWIVDADHDEGIKREDTEYMAAQIPNAGLLIQPDVSHFSLIQDPEQFNNDILHFLKPELTPARNCQSLICVRNNIDIIDSQIVKLIGLRLTYVKRAGELKKGKQPIHDQVRENQIILKVSQLATKMGYPGSIAAEIYKTLLIQTNTYEKNSNI